MSITYPFDIIRVRLSADMSLKHKALYDSFADCAKKLWKNEGVFSIYNGFLVSALGIIPYLAITFTSYDYLKQYCLSGASGASDQQDVGVIKYLLNSLGIGSVAGMVAQGIIHPIDTVRYTLWAPFSLRRRFSFRFSVFILSQPSA